jgi:hypothetical protein
MTPENKDVLDRFMAEKVYPLLAPRFREWKKELEAEGIPAEISGALVLNQIIGFGIHTYLFNHPDADRDELINWASHLIDEMLSLFHASRKKQ